LTQAIAISFGADNVLFFMSTEEQCVGAGARYGAKPSTSLRLPFGWTFNLHSCTGNYPELCSLLNWQILVQSVTDNPAFMILCFFGSVKCTDEVVVYFLFSFACTTIWVLGIRVLHYDLGI